MTWEKDASAFAIPFAVIHQGVVLHVDIANKTLDAVADFDITAAGPAASVAPGDAVPVLGFHQRGLNISSVTIDGGDATFSVLSGEEGQPGGSTSRLMGSVELRRQTVHQKGLIRFADECWNKFNKHIAETIEQPNLIVSLPEGTANKLKEGNDSGTGGGNPIRVSISYSVTKPTGGGIVFGDTFCYTETNFVAPMCWMPLVSPSGDLPKMFTLEVCTKSEGEFVVASGSLTQQNQGNGACSRVFHLENEGASAASICFAVGPFNPIATDEQGEAAAESFPNLKVAKYFASSELAKGPLSETIEFIEASLSAYEEYLGALPFKEPVSLCILGGGAGGVMVDDIVVGRGIILMSPELVIGAKEELFAQSTEARVTIAEALACQWFGQSVLPSRLEDKWLVTGIVGLLSSKLVVSKYLGANEEHFRWYKKMESVVTGGESSGLPSFSAEARSRCRGQSSLAYHVDDIGMKSYVSNKMRHKAELLVWMIEHKAGADPFQNVLQGFVSSVVSGSEAENVDDKEKQPYSDGRFLSVEAFFRDISKAIDTGADKKWLQGFNERWVVGRGFPHLTVAFCFNKKQHTISVAIRQQGAQLANISGTASVKCCGKEGSGMGMVTLVSAEADEIHKNSVFIGDQSLVLEDVKCRGKVAGKKRKRNQSSADLVEVEASQAEEANQVCGPIKWIDVHHNYEWFATFDVSQPEKMWIAQLESSKDIVIQLHAISGLVNFEKHSYGAVNALYSCLQNKKCFHRVRSEAALAMANTAGEDTDWAALGLLMKYYRESVFNPELFSMSDVKAKKLDVGEQLVSQSVTTAIALIRDDQGRSPQEASDFLLELLKFSPHDGIAHSCDERTASLVEAIGLVAPDCKVTLDKFLAMLRKFMQRDLILSSVNSVVSCACLQSLASIIVEYHTRCSPGEDKEGIISSTLSVVKGYLDRKDTFYKLKSVGHVCLVTLQSLQRGSQKALEYLIDVLEGDYLNKVKIGIINPSREILSMYRKSMHEPLGVGELTDVQDIMLDSRSTPVQLSTELFRLVQHLGKRPLYLQRFVNEALHEHVFVKLQQEAAPRLNDPFQLAGGMDIDITPRPRNHSEFVKTLQTADAIDVGVQKQQDLCMQSYTTQAGHTLTLGQRVQGKWRSGAQWYGGVIERIHQTGCFDIRYDDGDLELDVPIDRVIPEGGWQFGSNGVPELNVSSTKKASSNKQIQQHMIDVSPGDGGKQQGLYAQLLMQGSKPKEETEEEKRQKLVDELIRLATKILNGLRQHRTAAYFMKPVDKGSFGGESPEEKEAAFNEYLKIIDHKPMDLTTVTEKARGGEYKSPLTFRDDMRQIFKNCRAFNTDPESIVHIAGEKLSDTFEAKWKESGIEDLWEAGEIRPLVARVESRTCLSLHNHHPEAYQKRQSGKVKFEDDHTQRMWSLCLQVLRELKGHSASWPFLKPVDPAVDNAPNYFDTVSKPMDLGTITDKLANRQYENPSEFKADIELVFDNCFAYNKADDNVVRKAGEELRSYFKSRWEKSDIESKFQSGSKSGEMSKEDEMWRECDRIVHFLKKHKCAKSFLKPVTEEHFASSELWEKYKEVVKRPMDISSIARKQKKRRYKTIDEFKDDVMLIFENCFKFNFPGDPVHKAGQQLKAGFKARWRKLQEKFGLVKVVTKPVEEAWRKAQELVKNLTENDLSVSFRAPVDRISVPDYYDVIKNPMDLCTIQRKLDSKQYANPSQLRDDMLLLFANCKQYNTEGDPMRARGEELLGLFETMWKESEIDALFEAGSQDSGGESQGPANTTASDGTAIQEATAQLSNDSDDLMQEQSNHNRSLDDNDETSNRKVPDHETADANALSVEGTGAERGPKKVAIVEGVEEGEGDTTVPSIETDANKLGDGAATDVVHGDVVPPSSMTVWQECQKVVFMLKKHKSASAFIQPVTVATFGDPQLWEKYMQVVGTPMDLATISDKLKERSYSSPVELMDDILLVFENCYKFNYSVDPVYQSAVEVQEKFLKRWIALESKYHLDSGIGSQTSGDVLDEIWSKIKVIITSLMGQEEYEKLRSAETATTIDLSIISSGVETGSYTDPVKVRDDIRFQMRQYLSCDDEATKTQCQTLEGKFEGLWREEQVEHKLSRIIRPKVGSGSGDKSNAAPVGARSGSGSSENLADSNADPEKDTSPKSGLTLKIKLGALNK